MKKICAILFALTLMSSDAYADGISVVIDGEKAEFAEAPYIDDGYTFVPMRGIFEKLGADISWNDETKTVGATFADTKISLAINSDTIYKNGEGIHLDKPAVIVYDKTFVPLRAVSEAFGHKVDYDGEASVVTITTLKPTPTSTLVPTSAPINSVPMAVEKEINGAKTVSNASVREYTTSKNVMLQYDIDLKAKEPIPEEIGVLICDSRDKLSTKDGKMLVCKEDNIIVNTESTNDFIGANVTAVIDANKSGLYLKENSTYYYRMYLVSEGVRYWDRNGTFTTYAQRPVDFSFLEAETTDITADNAVLNGSCMAEDITEYNPAIEYGFYFGTSVDSMQKFKLPEEGYKYKADFNELSPQAAALLHKVITDKSGTITYLYDLKEDANMTLAPNTEYFWRFYTVWDGEEYTTDIVSFTTKEQ